MKKEYKIYETPKNTPAYGTVGNLSGSRKSASGTVKKTTAAKTTAAKNTAGKSSSGGRAPVIYHEQVKPGAAGSLASNAGKTGANVKKPSPVAAAKPGAQSTAASKPAASKPASAQKPVIYREQINPGAAGTLASNAGRTGKNTARPLSSTNWFLTHKPAAHTQSSDPFLSAFEDDGPSWHEKIYNAYHKSLPKRKKDDTVDMFLEEFDKEETPERRFYGEQVSPGAAGALTGLSSTRRKPIYHEQISPGARGGLEENAQYSAQKQYGRTDQASLAGSLAQNGAGTLYSKPLAVSEGSGAQGQANGGKNIYDRDFVKTTFEIRDGQIFSYGILPNNTRVLLSYKHYNTKNLAAALRDILDSDAIWLAADPKNKLVRKEYWEALKSPINAIEAYKASQHAEKYSYNKYGYNLDGTRQNALKHALWNTLMTIQIGEKEAERFASAHEVAPYEQIDGNGFTRNENTAMDYYYNNLGREIGAKLLSDYSEIMPNGERRITLSPDEIAEYVDQIIETNQSHIIDREGK